jgi:hypothetical protein
MYQVAFAQNRAGSADSPLPAPPVALRSWVRSLVRSAEGMPGARNWSFRWPLPQTPTSPPQPGVRCVSRGFRKTESGPRTPRPLGGPPVLGSLVAWSAEARKGCLARAIGPSGGPCHPRTVLTGPCGPPPPIRAAPGPRATCTAVLFFGVFEAYPPLDTTPGAPGRELPAVREIAINPLGAFDGHGLLRGTVVAFLD